MEAIANGSIPDGASLEWFAFAWGEPTVRPADGSAPRVVSAEELQSAGLMSACISALERRMARGWDMAEPARSAHAVGGGQLLVMPGWDAEILVVKLATIRPPAGPPSPDEAARARPRVQGIFVVIELPAMTPVMVVDAAALTALRTPAVSAVATKHLARPDASRLVVFGTGPQAAGHVEAMRSVRPIEQVGIVGRSPGSAERMAAELRDAGVDAAAVTATAVAEADVVCTCTTSRTPVFDGSLLPDVVHVNAVGSHEPGARELDDATFRGALAVVDSVEMALREAGDVIMAMESGALPGAGSVVPLAAVVETDGPAAPAAPPRPSARTVFKSVGTAGQDLVAGELLLKAMGAAG